MRIALLDTFYDTSHRHWTEGLIRHIDHDFTVYFNKAKSWKWQMTGGVLNFIEDINNSLPYDLIVASDMVNLPLLKSSLNSTHQKTPMLVYFHENQITYPWSPTDQDPKLKRDHHYGWINYMSAVLADGLMFNSEYHRESFLRSLPGFIKMFPKFKELQSIESMQVKSTVLPIGIEAPLNTLSKESRPIILWNHRWEYDKNPEAFFRCLYQLSAEGRDFGLVVVGKKYKNSPPIYQEARKNLKRHILHWGWVESRKEYEALLDKSNILLVTSYQDFFGISIVQAIAHGCYPILPHRLCYPEHIPQERSSDALYVDNSSMISILTKVLEKKLYLHTDGFQEYISKYYWTNVIGKYEDLFTNKKKPSA